jgi:hypothetical protein
MTQPALISKRIVFCEFSDGPGARLSGSYFVAILTPSQDEGTSQTNLIPACWGHNDVTAGTDFRYDEVKLGRILDEIAEIYTFQGEHRIEQALQLLQNAGEEGISVELSANRWREIDITSNLDKRNQSAEHYVPLLER